MRKSHMVSHSCKAVQWCQHG